MGGGGPIQIWGGSANVEPLPFGIDTESTATPATSKIEDELFFDDSNTSNITQVEEPVTPTFSVTDSTVNTDDTSVQDFNSRKRTSAVPALVDNKRKHLECSLSAAQHYKILLDEAKEDA